MINKTKAEEEAYLEAIKQKLTQAMAALGGRVRHYAREISEQKTYLSENKADRDHEY